MTHTNDIEELPTSPEDDDSKAYLGTHSTEDLPAAIQAESYARTSAGIGSSHTKITFVPAGNATGDDDDPTGFIGEKGGATVHPRHRSPPPYAAAEDNTSGPAFGGTGVINPWPDQDVNMDNDPPWNAGFSLLEEDETATMWWNASNRRALRLLGPGMLPVLAASRIHEESHTLVAVTVNVPDIPVSPPETSSDSNIEVQQRPFKQPRSSDVHSAVPHPNSFYCPKCNGWIIVQATQTTDMPIHATYKDACADINFPSPPRTEKRCNASFHYGTSDREPNPLEAHHYHLYEDAIPSTSLNPPFERNLWEETPPLPKKACSQHESATDNFWKLPTHLMLEVEPDTAHEGINTKADYLDLYSCCVCMHNVYVTRNVIPGVVSPRLLADLSRERQGNDRNFTRVSIALEFIVKILEGTIWKGDQRPINFEGKSFQRSFGGDAQAFQIWSVLGYQINNETKQLIPPSLDTLEPRQRLLRAWVELSACTAEYLRGHPQAVSARLKDGPPMHKLWVKTNDASDQIADLMGSHPNEIPRGNIEAPQASFDPVFHQLGLTQASYTPRLLMHAYRLQTRCDLAHLPLHYEALLTLVDKILPQVSRGSTATLVTDELGDLIVMERSKDRWTPAQYEESLQVLGFGPDRPLQLEISEIDAEFLENAYKDLLRQTWRPQGTGYGYGVGNDVGIGGSLTWDVDLKMRMGPEERRQYLKESLRIVAEGTGRPDFYAVYKRICEPWAGMDPQKAYTTLGVPSDTTDDMLLTVHQLRVQDAPSSEQRMTEALQVLCEARNSARIREYLRSGVDPGEEGSVIMPDWPRGLNQLGNTCYLNSLLQYFYTIKDLRQVILSMKPDDLLQQNKGDKLTDAQLQKHRVGGRLVTRKEIERSRHFLVHLSELFTQMACGEAKAITPSIELAKLALVTSKDEEEDEAKANPTVTAATSSSPSTDATLVEEVPGLHPPLLPSYGHSASTSAGPAVSVNTSVLGKRPREADADSGKLEAGTSEAGNTATKPRSPRREDSPPPDKTMRLDEPSREDQEMNEPAAAEQQTLDVKETDVSSTNVSPGGSTPGSPVISAVPTIAESAASPQPPPLPKRQPPPLPPRKQPAESVMMFGKQHDVAECMDNCMFQIETALLDFEGPINVDVGKTSVIKSLFYGKMRQRITTILEDPAASGKTSVNEKDDLFSHLPVNVSEEGYDIHDGLSGYFRDTFEFEGKKATMEVTLVDLPPVLQIQLQRVQFNRETLQPYKSQSYIKFGESLYMDRYLEDADPEKRLRSKQIHSRLATCRDRINTLTNEHGVLIPEALKSTAGFLSSEPVFRLMEADGISEFLSETLTEEGTRLEKELASLRAEVVELKAELEELWRDEQMAEYELTSVFIHRGSSPSWGHYFFYARNLPDKPDEWFKYNDSVVSTAKKEEVLADTTGSTANPYLLVFARKGAGVVHTVNRQA